MDEPMISPTAERVGEPLDGRVVALRPSQWRWLEAYAKDRGMSVDEYLAYTIRYFEMDMSRSRCPPPPAPPPRAVRHRDYPPWPERGPHRPTYKR